MIDAIVKQRTTEADGIVSFQLAPVSGVFPAWEAGSHVDVEIAKGLVRQYSLCSRPEEATYRIAVLRDNRGRGGSRAVHEIFQVGHELRISTPRNHFRLEPKASRSLLLAGGIGITPLLAMAYALHADNAAFDLHYCVRTKGQAAFLHEIRSSGFAESLHLYCSEEDGDRLDMKTALDRFDSGYQLYVCGSKRFTDAALSQSMALGWSAAQTHYELFAGGEVHASGDGEFEVELARSRNVVAVLPGQTITEALAAEGIEIPTSCEQGVCGTCLTRVLAGRADHRDFYLTDDERKANNKILPCCSRALSSRLILDL